MSEYLDEKAALECAGGDARLAAFHKALSEIATENTSISFRLYCAIEEAARRAFCAPATPPRAEVNVEWAKTLRARHDSAVSAIEAIRLLVNHRDPERDVKDQVDRAIKAADNLMEHALSRATGGV